MTESSRPTGDENSVWESDIASGPKPASSASAAEPETYPIPGGLGGWSPADLPSVGQVVAKTPPRDDPKFRGPRIGSKKHPTSDWWALAGFNLLVFVSSVCVMTLELTASRLIAKHVGSSLYTWTSVIGVVLAGITIGNYLGGWLADRFNRARVLSWMYLLGSVSCTSVLWLDQIVAGISRPEDFSWPMWVLCVVAMIFLLPALLLGTTSPLVASMALARSTRHGLTVGNVYAWGAFGSIVGTFLTGFYLIDVWGTRSIIGLVAAVLALLAVSVAGTKWVFRTAVICGWLQLLTWCLLAATMTRATGEAWGERIGEVLSWGKDEVQASMKANEWRNFGGNLWAKVHEIGLLVKLRDDQPGQYHDESSYSYIQVGDDYTDGAQVRYLRLDKLIHAYYEPDNPTALHYEYEQVYAAVTKQTAPGPNAAVSVRVPEFPGADAILARLPAGVTFDAATRTLKVDRLTAALADELRNLSGDADYWTALERLHKDTTAPNWGGFSTAPLDKLPEGVTIPTDLFQTVRYDDALDVFTAYSVLSPELRERLANLSPQAPWRRTIQSLRRQAGPVSALFLGGGGFVFPRWFAAEFPGATRIDVAELDPGVYRAVQLELGFSEADENRINTEILDARNFVEDGIQENRRLKAKGQPPVLYDFIYGDAFNDFSVPFHLATVEFNQKLRDLLTPQGVVQQNIIDMYPRTEAPRQAPDETEKRLLAIPLPDALVPTNDLERDWTPCPAPFAGVETYRVGQNGYVLGFRGSVSDELHQGLIALNTAHAKWKETIDEGVKRSRAVEPGRFLARYVQTAAAVFPCLYVFSTSHNQPGDDRDTFVVVCSQQPLDLDHLEITEGSSPWSPRPFATRETRPNATTPVLGGQMDSLLELSCRIGGTERMVLSDDFAPVDNLLRPVFALQE